MFQCMLARIKRGKSGFSRSRSGNVAITFALVLFPCVVMVGAALDYTRASSSRVELQNILDAALLKGVMEPDNKKIATATAAFNATAILKDGTAATPVFSLDADGNLLGTVTAGTPTSFMAVAGVSQIDVGVSGTAVAPTLPSAGLCLYAINTTIANAINLSGSASIDAPSCGLQDNSNSNSAVRMSGSTAIATKKNCIVGAVSNSSSGGVSPAPEPSCPVKADPFASNPKPVIGACTFANYKVSSSTTTLNPGVYCGGLTISSSNVTFAPGLYIIKDGVLTGSGGSSFTGNGVTFFLTGNGAGVNISGGGHVHLVASNNAPLAGFVFFLDPAATPAAKSVLSGTSELYYEGTLYFPNQLLELSGGSSSFTESPLTAYIADRFLLSGASAIKIQVDPTKTTVSFPDPLMASKGQPVHLIR